MKSKFLITAGPWPDAKSGRLPTLAQTAAIGGLLAMLAGCRAHVTDVVPIDAGGPPPVEILVDVAAASTIASEQAEPARKVSAKIESELIQRLAEAKITAEPFVPGAGRPGAAVLHVSIVKADPGNAAERFVVGFGLGRAELQANVDLESGDAADAHSMVGFHTSGDSGRKPGMILPGGVALATRDATHLAIGGGIKIATSSNDGIDVPAKRTAAAVVDQLEKYYASVGWTWPGGDLTFTHSLCWRQRLVSRRPFAS